MKYNRLIAMICVSGLIAANMAGCAGKEAADSVKTQNEIDEMDSVLEGFTQANIITHSDTAGKEETVYVIMDANGSRNETIVNEWLKNPEGMATLTDSSSLDDIEVVKGNASYVLTGGESLSWQADGSDVYYQGKTDKELPVEIKVSCTLDGKPVDASDIKNVSGHLTVRYDYENRVFKNIVINEEIVTVYQPFTMMTGVLFDGAKASNIEVTNGKVVNSGNHSVVFGVAMPGLSESLGIDKLDEEKREEINIPESVTIDADVVDFTMPMSMTVATNNALSALNLDKFDSIDDLKEKSDELSDGMSQLLDGTDKLDKGMHQLADGTSDLSNGTVELDDGAGKLNDGAVELVNGVRELNDGACRLNSGASELNTGAGQLNSGAGELYAGTNKLHDGTVQLKAGLDTLNEKTPALAEGVSQLKAGTDAVSAGVNTLESKNDSLNAGAKQLADGITAFKSSLSAESPQMAVLSQGTSAISGALDGVDNAARQIAQTAAETQTVSEGDLAAIKGSLEAITAPDPSDFDMDDSAQAAAYAKLSEAYATAQSALTIVNSYEQAIGAVSAIQGGATQIVGIMEGNPDAGITGVKAAFSQYSATITSTLGQVAQVAGQLENGAKTLQGGVSEYTTGVSQVSAGIGQVKAGATALNEKVPELTAGVSQLSGGATQLESGASELSSGAGKLYEGTDKLSQGASQLANGTNELVNGTAKLMDGTVEFSDGVVKLKDGTFKLRNGASDLSDGVAELVDGSGKLKDGVIEFDEKGISKIEDLINNDLESYYDRLKAVRNYADEYTSFTSADSDSNNSVKFIYKINSVDSL